jgi:hypothetical protein
MKQFFSLIALASLCPAPSLAQDAEPGGVFLTFELDQRFEGSSDRDLATTEAESGFDSITALAFGAVSETRAERLSLDLETDLRIAEGELTNDESNVRLAYSRNSADSVLDMSVNSARSDIAFLRDASDFINSDGELILPDDFDDLTGTGIRFATTVAANLRWGETDPLGYRIGVSHELLRYNDASADLIDADTSAIEAGIRLNINEVTTANVDLRYTETDEVGSSPEDSISIIGELTFDRPLGDLTAGIRSTRDDDGDTFWALSIDRSLALPTSAIEASLGLVEDDNGDAVFTGGLAYSYPLPIGQIDLSAARNLAPGDERLTTTVQASYARDLSPTSDMRLSFDYARAQDTEEDTDLSTGGVTAVYGVSLTQFWRLNVGASADVRDDDGTRTRSNTVFLGLNRNLSWRP